MCGVRNIVKVKNTENLIGMYIFFSKRLKAVELNRRLCRIVRGPSKIKGYLRSSHNVDWTVRSYHRYGLLAQRESGKRVREMCFSCVH